MTIEFSSFLMWWCVVGVLVATVLDLLQLEFKRSVRGRVITGIFTIFAWPAMLIAIIVIHAFFRAIVEWLGSGD